MKGSATKLILAVIGIATSYAVLRRGVKVAEKRASLRTYEEKEVFENYDTLKKDVEAVEWKEKAELMKLLACNELYKAAKDRIFELRKLAADSKNVKVKHHDLEFGFSSGNESMYRDALRREENYLKSIEETILKKIQSQRSEDVRQLFDSFESITKKVRDILKHERAGLWKEVFFGKV